MVPDFTHKDVMRHGIESLAEVKVDSIHCSPFIHPGMDEEGIAVREIKHCYLT